MPSIPTAHAGLGGSASRQAPRAQTTSPPSGTARALGRATTRDRRSATASALRHFGVEVGQRAVDGLARSLDLVAAHVVVQGVELPEDQVSALVHRCLVAIERADWRSCDAASLAVVLAAVARAGEARRVGLHRTADVHARVADRRELLVAVVADVGEPPRE